MEASTTAEDAHSADAPAFVVGFIKAMHQRHCQVSVRVRR
jgi:hypothetical protein